MNPKWYSVKTTLLALVVSPLLVSLGVFLLFTVWPLAFIMPIALIALWYNYARRAALPERAGRRYLPLFISFAYYLSVWIICFGLSRYTTDGPYIGRALFKLAAPFFGPLFLMSFDGGLMYYPLMLAALYGIVTVSFMAGAFWSGQKAIARRGGAALFAAAAGLCAVYGYQLWDRSATYLFPDHVTPRVEHEVDLYQYRPFREESSLVRPDEAPALIIDADYPRLDGATAAYPVYAAAAEFLYRGLDAYQAREYVRCSQTAGAYESLIGGEADIIFAAQPSEGHLKMAREKGVELRLTPIAREAFVFFVNRENPVESLTVRQIRDIYQKKITNWRELGGLDKTIRPFQRPENSGSQTTMLARVMGGEPLPPPLMEEYAAGMGGVIQEAATYRNYVSALGYSFRFFATGLKPNPDIKLLAIDGVAPTVENIRSGEYPFTVEVYAVTTRHESENTRKLLEWLRSDQGRRLIEKSGYVAGP